METVQNPETIPAKRYDTIQHPIDSDKPYKTKTIVTEKKRIYNSTEKEMFFARLYPYGYKKHILWQPVKNYSTTAETDSFRKIENPMLQVKHFL